MSFRDVPLSLLFMVAILFSGAGQILVKRIIGNIHVKLFEIWTSDSGDVVQRCLSILALVAILFSRAEPFVHL